MHSRRLIHEIGSTVPREQVGIGFFVAGLCIRRLGISHACSNAGREVVETTHLATGRHQDRLLATASGHGSGSEVGYKRPGTEDGWVRWTQKVDVHEAREDFGHRLNDGSRECSGAGGSGLEGGEEKDGHAAAHAGFKDPGGVLTKA